MGFGQSDGFTPIQLKEELATSYILKVPDGIEATPVTMANPSYTLSVA